MIYKLVCGIETHIELATDTKVFCSCTTAFGGEPNTHCCPVCTGQPGALPVLNRKAVELAIRAGLALGCDINLRSHTDRKNYVYPDLPKAYQISQFDEPLCVNGQIVLSSGKIIRIERIHIEEDAGKLIHSDGKTFIDYNRAGVPLIEIVSHADIETPQEAYEYAAKLQRIMRYAGVSDCKMQEGSMRCDVNVSLHKENEPWGTRTEIKNINSLSNIVKAMELEMKRQEAVLLSGERVRQATMRYDEHRNKVYVLRVKENADDYRFFPEPDIPPLELSDSLVDEIKSQLPELPDSRLSRYLAFDIPENSCDYILEHKRVSDFFDSAVNLGASPRNALNMIIGPIFEALKTDSEKETFDIKITAEQLADLIKLLDAKRISPSLAKQTLYKMLDTGKSVNRFITENELTSISDGELTAFCKEAIAENPKAADDVRNGTDKAINVLFGAVMKKSKGKANIRQAEKIIRELL